MKVTRPAGTGVSPLENVDGFLGSAREEELSARDVEHRRELRLVARPFQERSGAPGTGNPLPPTGRRPLTEPLDHPVPGQSDRLDALVAIRSRRRDRFLEQGRCPFEVCQLEIELRELGQQLEPSGNVEDGGTIEESRRGRVVAAPARRLGRRRREGRQRDGRAPRRQDRPGPSSAR